ncbi:MAG: hypothetical protein CSA65_05690 [Proteobacteria bacterium]|nr:MAG: hypothetical protein CSB49_02020 [Pseudomonadota bacterium]PIE18210.1 MAG: hypothetical protein CSA65_05690 [Pseudomonadota bacterium]
MLARYLLRQALPTTLLALALLCVLVFGLQALRLGHHLVGGGGGLALLGVVFGHSLPSLLTFALPLALAAGVLLSAARLRPELEAMQTLGASAARLAPWLLGLVATAAALSVALAAWVEPVALQRLGRLLRREATRALVSGLEPGVFRRVGDATLYLERRGRAGRGELLRGEGFLLARGPTIVTARRASLRMPAHATRLTLTLEDGELHRESPGLGLQRLRFAKLERDLELPKTLFRHFAFLGRRGAHARVSATPRGLATLAAGLLAIVCALAGAGRRPWLLVGLGAALLLQALSAVFDAASVAGWAIPGAAAALAIGLLTCCDSRPWSLRRHSTTS